MAGKTAAKIVTVKDLAEEFEMEPREVRIVLRSNGLRAPATKTEGFGPRSKYQWEEGSDELTEVRKALEAAVTEGDEDEVEDEVESDEVDEADETESPKKKATKKRVRKKK